MCERKTDSHHSHPHTPSLSPADFLLLSGTKFIRSGDNSTISNNGRTCKHTGGGDTYVNVCSAGIEVSGSSGGSSASTSSITRALFQVVLDSGASSTGGWGCDDGSMDGVLDDMLVGIMRPAMMPAGVDHDKSQRDSDDGWWLDMEDGSLWGNGQRGSDPKGGLGVGDRVGVLVDTAEGSVCWYRNGEKSHTHTAKVTGPLVLAVQTGWEGQQVTITAEPVMEV